MKLKIFLLAIVFCIAQGAYCQSIEGYVLDGMTGEPIENASVYIDGSTMGVISKVNGHFNLNYDDNSLFTLVISHLGYKTFKVQDPDVGQAIKVYLKEDIESLKAAVIMADPWSREKRLREFKQQFFGEGKAAKACVILNEADLDISYDAENNVLTASSYKPIVIRNNYLGYTLYFDLQNFKIIYRDTRIEEFRVRYTEFNGAVKFEDHLTAIDQKNGSWLAHRQKSYKGSILHFMRSLYEGDEAFEWHNFKFINQVNLQVKDNFHGMVPNLQRFKEVRFDDKLVVLYKRVYRTLFKLRNPDGFTIDKFGNYRSGNNVIIEGDMTLKRVGDLLPFDYQATEIFPKKVRGF